MGDRMLRLVTFVAVVIAITLVIAVVFVNVTDYHLYEDGSYTYTLPIVGVKMGGCFPPMGCLLLDELLPVEEEWLHVTEYIVGGPMAQNGTIVISGWNHSISDYSFWDCYGALDLCILRHDDRPIFHRLNPIVGRVLFGW